MSAFKTSDLFTSPLTAPKENKEKKDLFGSLNLQVPAPLPTLNLGSSQPTSNNSLLSTTSQPQQTGGLFSNTAQQKPGGLFSNTTQPQQSNGLFGASTQPQQNNNLFGQSQSQPSGLGGGLFQNIGSITSQPQQNNNNLFGGFGQSTQQQQQPQQQGGGSLFGTFGQPAQQQQQPQPQQSQQPSVLGQSLGQSRLFQNSEIAPRQKSVIDQIELAFAKWNPESPHTLFQTYLYNTVPEADAPFYGPGPNEDETQWEEALAKKPSTGSIPVSVRGFEQLGLRMRQQYQNLAILQGRLHEINSGLTDLLQKHESDTSVRAAECRRKHLVLSKQCLRLAAKTQVLRNRGYALDSAEEELRKKLAALERGVLDPEITGRGDEIWARMTRVRERGQQLQREFERAGRDMQAKGATIDEEVMIRAKKILEDYHFQLEHLTKEMAEIQKDWKEYIESRSLAPGLGR